FALGVVTAMSGRVPVFIHVQWCQFRATRPPRLAPRGQGTEVSRRGTRPVAPLGAYGHSGRSARPAPAVAWRARRRDAVAEVRSPRDPTPPGPGRYRARIAPPRRLAMSAARRGSPPPRT